MQHHNDPVDNVMKSLGDRTWPGDYDNQQLKEKIMQNCLSRSSGPTFRSRGAIVAILAFVALGSVGFAAAGGIEMIKGWIITVEVDGPGEVTIDEDDVYIETDDEGVTTITIDGAEVEGAEEGATVTITAVSTDDGTMVVEGTEGQASMSRTQADESPTTGNPRTTTKARTTNSRTGG